MKPGTASFLWAWEHQPLRSAMTTGDGIGLRVRAYRRRASSLSISGSPFSRSNLPLAPRQLILPLAAQCKILFEVRARECPLHKRSRSGIRTALSIVRKLVDDADAVRVCSLIRGNGTPSSRSSALRTISASSSEAGKKREILTQNPLCCRPEATGRTPWTSRSSIESAGLSRPNYSFAACAYGSATLAIGAP